MFVEFDEKLNPHTSTYHPARPDGLLNYFYLSCGIGGGKIGARRMVDLISYFEVKGIQINDIMARIKNPKTMDLD
jgi:hypothetical protein